jgi:hypothetical protein
MKEGAEEKKDTEGAKEDKKKELTVYNSIKENYLSWICIYISVCIISYPNCIIGNITFIVLVFLSYFMHKFAHYKKNIFTILHHYHHENDNFFSHFSQILLEIMIPLVFIPIYIIYGTIFLNEWVILLYLMFYTTVHNINYARFRVNTVHYLHHKSIHTNIGPDVCDIMFHSKHPTDTCPENTNHYIPNIIIGTIVVLIIQYLYKNDTIKGVINKTVIYSSFISFLILLISSIYLVKDCKWNDFFTFDDLDLFIYTIITAFY